MLKKSQVREILLNTYAPENVGNGGYNSDLAYKFCNNDIGVKDLPRALKPANLSDVWVRSVPITNKRSK